MNRNDDHGPRSGVGARQDRPLGGPVVAVPGRHHTAMPHFVHGKEHAMRRALIILVGTGIAAIPAAMGLFGNASFAERLPVKVPAAVSTASPHAEPGDDKSATSGSDDPATHDATDDHGGATSGSTGSDTTSGHDAGNDHGGSTGGHGSDG